MFDVQAQYSNGFECVCDGVLYLVTTLRVGEQGMPVTHVYMWIDETETWSFDAVIPPEAMRQIALELYLVFDILLDGYQYLSPSDVARKREVNRLMLNVV